MDISLILLTVCVHGLLLFIILPLGVSSVLMWYVCNALKRPKLIVVMTREVFVFAGSYLVASQLAPETVFWILNRG